MAADTIENLRIIVDLDIADALESIGRLMTALSNLETRIEDVDEKHLDLRTLGAQQSLQGVNLSLRDTKRTFESLDRSQLNISTAPSKRSVSSLERQIARLRRRLRTTEASGLNIPMDIEGEQSQFASLLAQIEAMEQKGIKLPIKIDKASVAKAVSAGVAAGMSGQIAGGISSEDQDLARFIQGMTGGGILGTRRRSGGRRFGGMPVDQMSKSLDQISDFDDIMKIANFRMATWHNLMAKFVPLLFTITASLPAVITGLVALAAAAVMAAGALAVIGGLGLIGAAAEEGEMPSLQEIGDVLKELLNILAEGFMPLARQLAPVFEGAVSWFERFVNVISRESFVLLDLIDLFAGFGDFMMTFMPQLIRATRDMLLTMRPAFQALGNFLLNTSALQFLADVMVEMLPTFMLFLDNLRVLIPAIVRLSTGFLVVTSAIMTLLRPFAMVMNAFPTLARTLGVMLGLLLSLATIISIVVALKSLWAFVTNTQVIAATASWVKSLGALGSAITAVSAKMAGLVFWQRALIYGLGAIAVVGALTVAFDRLTQSIAESTNALKDFHDTRGTGSFNTQDPTSRGNVDVTNVSNTVNVGSTGDGFEDRRNVRRVLFELDEQS